MPRDSKTGRDLELYVAEAYRQIGAWKVEHDIDLVGNQIDVYAELATPGHLLHRIAVEVKDWKSPVGIDIVNKYGHIVKLLRGERIIDEGIIVSAFGFSRQARRAAQTYGIRLLEPADLDTMVAQAGQGEQIRIGDLPIAPSLPVPPSPYLAHPYPLQENFTGRIHERWMLNEWFTTDQRPILALVAMGGMGKSALAWAWLQRDVLGLSLPGMTPQSPGVADDCGVPEAMRPEGVLWWSFYEPEASFAAFLDSALAYVSKGEKDLAGLSAHDKTRELVNFLQHRHFLVVLDGFERELRAYASLSAVYQGDAVAEDSQDDYRACTDIHAAYFLRWTAALALKSRVLLTSRFLPLDLDDLAGCRREDLTAMDPDDAVTFFHAQGVKGTRAEIQVACEPCGYHPLTLRLLSGMIANDPTQPGDIDAVAGYDLIDDLVARERHILAMAYDALRPPLRELLSRLAAFRSPVEYEVAALLSPFEGKRDLGHAFSELSDRGLIFFDQERWCYDLHPIIRAYAYDRLNDKERIHRQLRDYFAAVPLPEADQVNSLEDLAPIIELYHHTVCAAQYDEAIELFHDHLADPLYYLFGAYRTEIDLLCALFPDDPRLVARPLAEVAMRPEIGLPRLKDPSAQAWTLNALASSYTCSGQPYQAIPLLKMHNALQERLGDLSSLSIGLGNLANVQLDRGELKGAERNLRASIEHSQQAGQLSIEASGRADLGLLLAYEGIFDEADQQIEAAIRAQIKIGQAQLQVLSHIHRAQLALLMGMPQLALQSAKLAFDLAERTTLSSRVVYPARSSVWVYWLLGTVHVELEHLVQADRFLGKALTRCRHINLVELEPDILLSWARWHRMSGAAKQARECALEALLIASRSEFRLKEADICNFLAHCDMDAANFDTAQKYAEKARQRAWCDGPPHCYKLALDEANGLLELIDGRSAGC
jgi:tetratricopeptide (TPR) repeat protein